MTVKELISLNQMITDIVIEVRDNGTLLLDKLCIGCAQVKPPYPTRVPKEPRYAGSNDRYSDFKFKDAGYISKSINAWDDGKEYWQVKPDRIPKKWLDLEVYSWDNRPARTVATESPRRGGMFRNTNFHGEEIHIVALPNGQTLDVPVEDPRQQDNQLEGQMSIDDWNYEVNEI